MAKTPRQRQIGRDGDGDGAAAGPHIRDLQILSPAAARSLQHEVDQRLGLLPGHQDVGTDHEVEAVELPEAPNIRQGLTP